VVKAKNTTSPECSVKSYIIMLNDGDGDMH
jgi:hypothetical protein